MRDNIWKSTIGAEGAIITAAAVWQIEYLGDSLKIVIHIVKEMCLVGKEINNPMSISSILRVYYTRLNGEWVTNA